MKLTTRYLGLELKNPLVASAGPLNGELDNIRRLEDLGAAAVVLPSIFEEQVEHEQEVIDRLITVGIDSHGEALSYFPAEMSAAMAPARYLQLLERAKRAVDIPVIASLNGVTDQGWLTYAKQLEEAGASAIELNIYFIASDPSLDGRMVEERYVAIVKCVKQAVEIPVAVKIGPYFSAMANMAQRLEAAGADGLVLFNRFYQPDIDLATLGVQRNLELSAANEIRLPLLWISVLSGLVRTSLAASTGVQGADEVVKYLLAGADVVMTTSALLRRGVEQMGVLLEGLQAWLAVRGINAIDEVRGRMSQRAMHDPGAVERANYIRILHGFRANR
jgi:dihydroorotate dehydrogenase (fumarate)